MHYAVVIEQGPESYSAYSPDVPGCVAAAPTLEEVTRLMQEALAFHLEGLREDGLPIPEATTRVVYIDAA
jgi:predicted RNase H-like HicB family nuclease